MARRADRDDPPASARWWLCEGEQCSAQLWAWIDRLGAHQRVASLRDRIHEAIYNGRPLGSTSAAGMHPGMELLKQTASAPANLNITRSMVDTVCSRLGKRRPMPVISADDAGWTEKLFAKRASRVLRRKMAQPKVERLRPIVLRDALIRGTGVVHVYRDGGDVEIEMIPRSELVVDPQDARYGSPRTIARVQQVHKDVLCEMFPDRANDIRNAANAQREMWNPSDYDASMESDFVDVAAAHHLPSRCDDDCDDGCHVISIRGTEPLLDECYEHQRFPYAMMHWSPPTRGFWGDGLVEQLTGIQAKVNDLARDAQEAMYFASMLKVFTQRQSKVNKNHMRARHPVIIETDGPIPTFVAPDVVSGQQLEFMRWLIEQAYQLTGVSQASAGSKNPLGSNASGKALDTMYDIESDRFSGPELNYALMSVDIAACVLDVARDIAADDEMEKDDKARWITEIDWHKIEVDAGDYHVNLEPINFLPESRAGRLSTVKELAEAGLLQDQMQTLALFDEPDLNRANRHLLGPYRNLERIMEGLADESVPLEELVPDPQMLMAAPGLAKTMALGEYNNAAAEDAPDTVLGRYRWFLKMLESIEQTANTAVPQEPAAAMGGAPAPGPMGPPGPPGMAPPMPGNGMGGMDAMAAAGMPPIGMAAG